MIVPYRFARQFADGSYFVPCGCALLEEISEAVALGLLQVTNLGRYGDSNHSSTSRHSPHRANGRLWICAFDLGGRDYMIVAEFLRQMWNARDPRMYRFGFVQRGDGSGLSWDNGQWKWTGKDQGHCHGDFAMARSWIGGREDTGWWVDALASVATWGFIHWLKTGELTPFNANPIDNEHLLEDDMAAVPQSEWNEVRVGVKALLADADKTKATANEARRLGEVITRKRPPLLGELLPALAAGMIEPTWRSSLGPNETLTTGQALWASDASCKLVLQSDGNLVKYDGSGNVLWSAKKLPGIATMLKMQSDGNLVLRDAKGNALWHTGTNGKGTARLDLQTDKNLVVYVLAGDTPVWASGK